VKNDKAKSWGSALNGRALPSKHEALSLNPKTIKKEGKKE
jgi:hypothetical protein